MHRRMLMLAAVIVLSVASEFALLLVESPLHAQSSAADWEKAAGGKMSFDVASVKQNKSGPPPSGGNPHTNFPLDNGDSYSQNGGLLSVVKFPVGAYIGFAYKLTPSENTAVHLQLPKWATADSFDIEARAAANTTKDQMRLMMQSLLADRFKLAVHMETHDGPVFAIVLVNPGKTGTQLQPHSNDPPCADFTPAAPGAAPAQMTTPSGYPMRCGSIGIQLGGIPPDNHPSMSGRNITIQQIADLVQIIPAAGFDRPLVDETGLNGRFDFMLTWTPISGPEGAAGASAIFLDNMKDQLGLKLDSRTAAIRKLVIDHIEEPSPN
jgi:uncharacterized protein (TIGR03435 family)